MSIFPATFDIQIMRRSDWSMTLNLEDKNKTAINLTSYSAIAQIWDKDRTSKVEDITCTITDAANGEIKLSLTDSETTSLPDISYYDLKLTTGDLSDYWLRGVIYAQTGYSD